ncbi:uncharacterized protein LOC119081814 [Bradysia coprophila]|uniref:uncharacterized protein LOC119081814 n=1 Tax=Bradysia coprophila TaxID=38358 RepID=UPI00187D95C9|nr:uncharacterized protein LOC119081814 [Bradysia coprophila]XP_037046943.1 uncharacterized protein LOC119081814 [Bradysia coprophila]XP_037046944.1 uncharacterized protein LOC119081814 [Bradysia coprophila]
MSRRQHHRRIPHSSSLEGNDFNRARDDDDDLDVDLDLRDIPGQIEKEVRYIERNKDRSANIDADSLYADKGSGTRVGRWSGRRNAGESFEAGLLSTTAEASLYEHEMNVGRFNIGVVDDSDQKGVEAAASAVSICQRIGPTKVQCNALSAAYELGAGRNTGGFVRGSLASAGVSCGPVGANIGVGFDTGARVGAEGVEVRALGTGFMIDRNEGVEVSFFGTSLKFKPW